MTVRRVRHDWWYPATHDSGKIKVFRAWRFESEEEAKEFLKAEALNEPLLEGHELFVTQWQPTTKNKIRKRRSGRRQSRH